MEDGEERFLQEVDFVHGDHFRYLDDQYLKEKKYEDRCYDLRLTLSTWQAHVPSCLL